MDFQLGLDSVSDVKIWFSKPKKDEVYTYNL